MRLIRWIGAVAVVLGITSAVALLGTYAVDQMDRATRAADPYPVDSARPALAPFQRGLARMAAADYAGAIVPLEEATGADPYFASAWVARAQCEMRLGACDNAIASAERAIAVWAGNPWSTGDPTADQVVLDTYTAGDAAVVLWRAAGGT